MTANMLSLNCAETKFLLIVLKQQVCKIQDCSITTTHSERNLRFILDEHLTFIYKISALCNCCYNNIRELRCICQYLDFKIASTITTSIVNSKLHHCNSLYHNLSNCQLNRLQQIQHCLAHTIVNAPK